MKSTKIRNALVAAAMAAVAAACSQDRGADAISNAAAMLDAGQAGHASALAGAAPDAQVSRAHGLPMVGRAPQDSFASVPDRGDLVAYPQERVVRRAGPYTWHRADVSEAHALRAIVDGVLTLTAPSGERLRFQYDRHVEHESGDWTWIGHVVGGGLAQDAILTFGAEAVFGSIAQPGKAPLNLTIEEGASWLVETDIAARAAQSEASGRYGRPDFLVPPELPVVEGLRAQAAAVRGADALPATKKTIDLLVGYTSGFVDALSGRFNNSAAVTSRLNFLVDVTNESYVNSQVNAEVRLVHAMEVSYPDASENQDALVALTGSDGGATPTLANVDEALRPLHAARDQYGADLITLIRDFQHPEAVSCGIAWLLGSGQSFLHSGYEIYGMSVVSDGSDGGFFCEDTTFAHELGHNMGLAHDVETSKGDDGVLDSDEYGRYPYSFGYRTSPSQGDFYTVMAYSDEQVNGYRVFSNPDIAICGGFACGVEGQADNAETLRQTLGIIAMFRDTVVVDEPSADSVRNDLNGDGRSDLMWFHDGRNQLGYWQMDGATIGPQKTFLAGNGYVPTVTGDFNGDLLTDVVWTSAKRDLYLWSSDGTNFTSVKVGTYPKGWSLVGAGDIDGDGKADLLWFNPTLSQFGFWLMDGTTIGVQKAFRAGRGYSPVAVADFNGDDKLDVVWTSAKRDLYMWTGDGSGFSSVKFGSSPAGWSLAGGGDVDGDGSSDLLWFNDAANQFGYWLMDGTVIGSQKAFATSEGYAPAGAGDFDGDGLVDVLFTSSSQVALWTGTGTGFTGEALSGYPGGWVVAPAAWRMSFAGP